jgi:hypothetical protein
MRLLALALTGLVLAACGSNPAPRANMTASAPRQSTSSEPIAAPSSAATSVAGVQSYGLLVGGGKLDMIGTDARVAASVPMAGPTLAQEICNGAGAWILPAVSASNQHVYFRDGDTKIRMVIPPSSAVDVTTVPGGSSVISGFSVSPDDRRIAVSVEQFSSTQITDRLYVEDLRGHTHHANIYSATSSNEGKGPAVMLWPVGWHAGQLVLGVWTACSFEQVNNPIAYHVANPATAVRTASIGDLNCIPGSWPSPAGVACVTPTAPGRVRVYDWKGELVTTLATDTPATLLSPSGQRLAWGWFSPYNPPSAGTTMLGVDGSRVVKVDGEGCLWIDDYHVLANGAVFEYPSGKVTPVAGGGLAQCAGRFPGGL